MSAVAVLDGTTIGYAAPRPVPRRSTQPRLVSIPTGASVPVFAAPALRVTRAGRLVLTTMVLLVALVVAFVALTGGAAASAPAVTVTVQQGQTLSEIAAQHLAGVSVATGVAELQAANDLATAQVRVGQTIVIPQG
ncbi:MULTISPECIES: LysM peptidoglycan-binding domain-containing protein [unclassified Knoellia]|uniref:LysM peptidoglycan-binding domain-containing protein n=1 Tax=Knoellia altitudinis TaxID=3404795 RepID=UPI00361A5622